ncbi:MAG: Hsp20/alpha crystallin family protein [Deltaproteobacteria bacterium]|nr:MAG: Hsp20/alpha crystallin family protein [Deltaproteobacteria bacterium]
MVTVKWRPGLSGWQREPLSEMNRLRREMDRIWDSLSGTRRSGSISGAGVFPPLNVSEDVENVYVRAELPGVAAEDMEITTKDNNLVIKGERKIPTEGENVSYHRRERESGSFRRIISLPTQVDNEGVSAVCRNGVLTVTLPKAAKVKPRQVEVKSD